MSNITADKAAEIRVALREGSKVTDLLQQPAESKAVVNFKSPEAPKKVTLTDKAKAALVKLPRVFGGTEVTERRELTGNEVTSLFDEYQTISAIGTLMEDRKESIKQAVRNHIDLTAQQQGVGDTVDSHGFRIVASKGAPVRLPVEGSNEEFSLEYRGGRAGTMSVSSEKLLDMYEQGEISREDYLALTREKRVFDEDKATKAVLDNPALIEILHSASVVTGATAPSQSLFVRKAR